ncbi:MAG: DUF1674 domain-containing protein [Proteobacteria bacterium]|uniref:DUF1674 domain-containing protein n=1 Tax=Rudaea sp. TaxID=2136325 RepID=UPI001D6F54C3|nr:DUF1674 domain-containing protein [Pseudomonadota bacterium]MBS0567465.1 DUF1674 domain-containing protein [Pseudomonadota bacterium]
MSNQPAATIPAGQAASERDGALSSAVSVPTEKPRPKEIGGRGGLEPTRYGDWEKDGRCVDF